MASFPQASHQPLCTPLSSPIRATCPAHLIRLDFTTRTILGKEYRSFSSSLCSFLHSPVTSSLLGPNTLLNPYSQKPSVCVPPSMSATRFHTHFVYTDTKFYYILAFCAFEGQICKQVVSNCCSPVLLTEHKDQQFFFLCHGRI